MQISVDRRSVLIGGAAVLGLAAAGAVINLRHRALPREPGLVGHWTFDDAQGNAVLDSSGLANDGLILPLGLADESKWGAGDFAGTVKLSGGGDNFVRIPPSDSLNTIRSSVTAAAYVFNRAAWTPASPTDGFVAIVQRQWRTALHPDLFYLGFGVEQGVQYYKWHLGLVGSEVSLDRLPPGQTGPKANAWVHVAGTYDSDKGEMALYVDGEQIGLQPAKGDIRLDDGSFDRPLAIGAELNTASLDDASGEFDGYIDDVRLYGRALDAASIKALAEQASATRGSHP